MEDYFDMENYVTDQPFNILYLNMGIKKRISVYGYLKYDTNGNIPKVFFDIYNKITTYRNASAIEWFPQKIEVIFIEITEAKNKRQWIEGYPDLESDISWRWNYNDDRYFVYSVYLDIEYYPTFIDYYNLVKSNNEAVEINGKTMRLYYRFPFPIINDKFYNE